MTKKTKPVAKTKAQDKRTVTTETNDPLADLGLDLDTAPVAKAAAKPAEKPAAAAVAETAPAPEAAPETATRGEEVDVGEIEFGFAEFIPTAKRKAEGSKYQFDKLVAPGVFEDGPNKGKPKYAQFVVTLQPGTDEDKLRRSVQSATTQANKHGAAEGKYFVSRSGKNKEGTFVMYVIRTDAKPSK